MYCRWTNLGTILISLTAAVAQGAEWAQFRGPNGSAVSLETKLPAEWGKDQNIAWKVKVPGYGWSCPITWGDKIIVTSAVTDKQTKPSAGGGFGGGGGGRPGQGGGGFGGRPGGGGGGGRGPDTLYKFQISCLKASTGETIWEKSVAEQKPSIPTHGSNTYASETPITDGERIYAYFGMNGVYCYDLSGKELWKKDLGSYPMTMGWGTGSSPAFDGERIFVQCDNESKSFLVALDKKSGEQLWKVERPDRSGWSSPLVWKNNERTEVVCLGGTKLRSYEPATGKVLWELSGVSGQPQASMVASSNVLFAGIGGGMGGGGGGFGGGRPGGNPGGGNPGGFGGGRGGARPLFAIKSGANGDISLKEGAKSSEQVVWTSAGNAPAMSSPILIDGYLYMLEQRGGLLTCVDAKTGEQIYKERLQGARGFTSSPWAYDGKVFCLADDGTTFVVAAGKEFKVLGENKLDEMCWSSPAIADGSLYLRTVDNLYCIRAKK